MFNLWEATRTAYHEFLRMLYPCSFVSFSACLAFMTTEGAPTDKPPDAPVEEDEQQARAWDFPFPTPEETAVYHK